MYSEIYSVLLGIKSGVSGIRHAVDDTSTALHKDSTPNNDSFDITLVDSAEQDLPDQLVFGETHDVGTQTNWMAHVTATESELRPRLDRQGENNEAYVAPPENNHNHQMDCLALTLFKPGQHNDLDLEHLTIDQGRQDTLPENHTNVLQEINEENIRLRLQCDDLLSQRAALENDLSTSFIEKLDLEKRLSSAKRTIEKGRAYCKRIDAEWKRDSAKLQDMTRLFEANTENARYVEMLRQQNVLEEANIWLFGELQMRVEDNRFFACQRQAALQASSYHRACALNSEIQHLRQWLSTVQAQLADTGKARTRVEEELQRERLKHQEVRDAFYQKPSEPKLKMSSCSYNAQQTACLGGSTPLKPSKFTPTYPTGFQTRLPKAGAPPQFSSERKSESNLGLDTFFEPYTASSSNPQQHSSRLKSKFTFGDDTVSQSASHATGAATGAAPRTDFNFTFRGTMDHHSSVGSDRDTTESDLPKNSTSPNGERPVKLAVASPFSAGPNQSISAPNVGDCKMPLVEAENPQFLDDCDHGEDENPEKYMQNPCLASGGSYLASELPAEVGDNVTLLGGLQPKTTAENIVPCDSTKVADLYANRKAQNGAQKPLASDFFHLDSVKAEVGMNSMNALAAGKTSDDRFPIVFAGADVAQQTCIRGGAAPSTTVEGSVQAGVDSEFRKAERGNNPLSPLPILESPLPAFKEFPKPPKNKGRTPRRAFLRKLAKARKRAETGGAIGEKSL